MSHIKGYSVGNSEAKAAFTSEIEVQGLPSLQDVVNFQKIHRQTMDTRPGMYLKYLPHRYEPVNGELRSGGAYLFDTHENASDYWDRTANIFEPEAGVRFWDLPPFKTLKRFVWDVIGATNFAPVDAHAVGRFQRWSYEGADVEDHLRRAFPDLKKRAEDQGAVAFWLLHHHQEKFIGIQLAFPRAQGVGAPSVGIESLAEAANLIALDTYFPVFIRAKRVVDWTSLFLAIWLPRSRLAGGVPYSSPMYPTLPDVQK